MDILNGNRLFVKFGSKSCGGFNIILCQSLSSLSKNYNSMELNISIKSIAVSLDSVPLAIHQKTVTRIFL